MIKTDVLYIIPKGTFGDKNDNLQLISTKDKCDEVLAIVLGIGQFGDFPKFEPLNLFIQGNSHHGDGKWWIMIEHWSFDCDLFFEFCEFISNMVKLPLEIGFPK